MEKILNLTQHTATPEQVAQGVVDLSPKGRKWLGEWLTFETLPTGVVIWERAEVVADIAAGDSMVVIETLGAGYSYAMIGGAPFLMSSLESALIARSITPLYAFSVRESTEQTQPDGTVRKVNTFRHAGWVQI